MLSFIHSGLQTLAQRRRARRRAANLRAGAQPRGRPAQAQVQAKPGRAASLGTERLLKRPAFLIGAIGLLAGAIGAAVIAGHARHLGAATLNTAQAAEQARAADAYQAVLPGVAFGVPARPGLSLAPQPGAALLVAAGMQAAKPVHVDLCSQLLDPSRPRLSPLRLGYRFDDVKRWVARNEAAHDPVTLRNVLLLADADADAAGAAASAQTMPEVQISGMATPDFADPHSQPLQLDWRSTAGAARWIGDASLGRIEEGPNGRVALRQQGWLLWGAAALRIERRASAACPQAGELVVQMVRMPSARDAAAQGARPAKALVTAFPAWGKPVSAWLAPGQYLVPATPRNSLEDQALFDALQARGLLRLTAAGRIAAVPRDLPAWLASPDGGRAAGLAEWRDVRLDQGAVKLIKRLYRQADGAYVRQQIDVYNGELELLAWRARPNALAPAAAWSAGAGAAPLAATGQMPAAASRLFAEVPQGWSPWLRAVPGAERGQGQGLHLDLALAQPAGGGEQLELMLIGRAGAVSGARLHSAPACSGRACPSPDAVQHLSLVLLPGARAVRIEVRPLATAALGGQGDQQYRHLRLAGGKLVWQALNQGGAAAARPPAPSPVRLEDRNGVLLWADGSPTQPAIDAGLAPLLGFNAEHANSVAGMLARLPLPSSSRLSLDLSLQTLSQHALECVGMRRGHWDGKTCSGGQAAPEGRHAGMVILDTETGDVLAAAGAGTGLVDSANWSEVRDFDQANPARSPLRLPAFQHDGGAHQSPGSTFKVVSALGLEMAAENDPQIDSLLDGMPLAALNRLARRRGFGFETEAATYPQNLKLAHITNYKEQSLDRRAQDGRLGLAQALTYSLNTWFAWSGELSDRSLFGRPGGGAPDLQALDPDALDAVRPIVAAAHRLGFEQALRLDGGLLPADFNWSAWDALQATPAHIDPIHTRHELRQMAIGLRMQATPLQMALAAAAVGQGKVVAPRLLLTLGGAQSKVPDMPAIGVRLDRIRAGMKGVIDVGTGAGAFRAPALAQLRHGFYGKTGTAPASVALPDGSRREVATVWFTGWLEPGSLPGQTHRLALAAFVSHSDATGGDHAAPVVAAVLTQLLAQNAEQKAK
ncbi:MAG TPA: penicillin-binding transpeptidase domain-containing protein [Janthinobacterium sp.]|nr:penicillin-binding transpeptidase domain-containing protein [Janthinobacterium sp.]